MSTPQSSESSRTQLAAVRLALGLATLTFLVPLALAVLAVTAMLSFAAGSKSLRFAHGLDAGSFSAGFYLATLLLIGAGAWQIIHTVKARLARRAQQPQELGEGESKERAPAKTKGLWASLSQRPWMHLGVALLLIDISLVRWEIRGRLDSPDGFLAAAILSSMVWATVFVAVMGVRLTGLLWRTLLRNSRRSAYIGGLVTAFSLALSLASVLTIRSYAGETAEAAVQQNVVTSIEAAPSADSSLEQIRLAFLEFAEPKKTSADAQPLVKQERPSSPQPPEPAAEPNATAEDADPQAATALGILGGGTAALPTPKAPSASTAPPTSQPADEDPKDESPTEPDAPLLGIAFSPPFAVCVDQLTTRKKDEPKDPIERHVDRLVGHFAISAHDARALVIETLVSVCVKKAEDREDLGRYFQRSVTNAGRNFVTRRLNNRRTCSIELQPVLDFPDETNNWHYADETEQRATHAFCELSEIDQALVSARVQRGLTFGDIGAEVGLTESGAAKAFDRALRRLKQNFEKN